MDRLEALRVFVAVVDEQSFAGAARRLRMSAPAVTRAVGGLEGHLGAKLLHRTTRLVRLTAVGERYLSEVKRILGELEQADLEAAGSQSEPRGELSVTAPMMFGRLHVAPILFEFLERHPLLTARTLFVDHLVDLHEEDLDLAVRIGRLENSSLKAVRVGSMRRIVCGSPRYLREHGVPQDPEELSAHKLIAFHGVQAHRHWAFRYGDSIKSVTPTPRLHVNTADVAIAAAVAGHGLTRVLSYQVGRELRDGTLQIVLADYEPVPTPVQLVHAPGRNAPARVRLFVEFAAKRLREVLSQIEAATARAAS